MQKPKILMVNIGFIPESLGGTEFYTHNLSKSLLQRGYDVTVLTALENMSKKRYNVIKTELDGIEVIKIANSPRRARSFAEHFTDPKIDDLFKEIIQEKKPNLIHFQHVAHLSGNLLEIAHQMNIPSIFTLHDYWYICFRSRLIRPEGGICPGPSEGTSCATCDDESVHNPMAITRSPLIMKTISNPVVKNFIANTMDKIPQPLVSQARSLLFKGPMKNGQASSNSAHMLSEYKFRHDFFKRQFQYPKFIISPSYHLKQRYEAVGYREILVLPLGYYQTDTVESVPFNGQLKVVFIGTIEPHKGVLVALKELLALQKLDKIKINIHGRIRDPLYYSEIKRLARQFPPAIIEFHGEFRSDRDLRGIFSQNHVMLFPSIWEENAPLVVREALLHGIPVIGSKLGGVPEVIDDGVNGFLFDPFSQGDLLRIIEAILNKPGLLGKISDGARNTQIESMESHTLKICDIYSRAIAGMNR